MLSISAAAALTCRAANDVPSTRRKSSFAHGVWPCSAQGRNAVRLRGNVEVSSWPGAAMSTKTGIAVGRAGRCPPSSAPRAEHVRERSGVARVGPRRRRRLVGVPRRRDRDDAPGVRVLDRVDSASGENVSRSAFRGSRSPPSERLITRAPLSTRPANRLGLRLEQTERLPRTTFATSSWEPNAMPATPTPLFVWAAISPATSVPWPCVSVRALPPTKLRYAAIFTANSGWVPSMPESITATLGPARAGSSNRSRRRARDRGAIAWRRAGRSARTRADASRRRVRRTRRPERGEAPAADRDSTTTAPSFASERSAARPSALDRGDDLVERSLARDPDGEARSVRGRGRDQGGGAGRQEEPSSPGDDPKDGRVARSEPATRGNACPVGAGRQLELHLERTGRIHRR